jgi:hypothetical protein
MASSEKAAAMTAPARMTDLLLPRRARGRPSPNAEATYQEQRQAFCALIQEIRSTMDFAVGVRGWCYILEGRGHVTKGEFDACENFITDCRKTGDLPLDICAEDDSRATIGLQREPDESDPRDHAEGWVDYLREDMPNSYRPFGFWDDQKVYVEVAVEKLDLRCGPFAHLVLVELTSVMKSLVEASGQHDLISHKYNFASLKVGVASMATTGCRNSSSGARITLARSPGL